MHDVKSKTLHNNITKQEFQLQILPFIETNIFKKVPYTNYLWSNDCILHTYAKFRLLKFSVVTYLNILLIKIILLHIFMAIYIDEN